MVGRTTMTTPRYGVKIVTVDPSQGLVEAAFKTGDVRQISVYTTASAFRWPQVGENWVVRQENGTWYLDSFWPDLNAANQFTTVAPGDLVLNAPTGIIRIIGSDNGSSDFTMQAPICGGVRLISGVATVAMSVIQNTSLIFLTAQDNNSVGTLRVSSRSPGASFTITSSNTGDSGMVAYQVIQNANAADIHGGLVMRGALMTIKTGP